SYRLHSLLIECLARNCVSYAPPDSTFFPYTTLFRSAPISHSGPVTRPGLTCHLRDRIDGVTEGTRRQIPAQVTGPAPRLTCQYGDRKSTRLNSSHVKISYAVFCLQKINYQGMHIVMS